MRPRRFMAMCALLGGLFGMACAEGSSELEGTCHLGTLGCQCLEGTCEVGLCSAVTGRCVLEEAATGEGTGDDGACAGSGAAGCPCEADGDCDHGLMCTDEVCDDPSAECGFADLDRDPENCGACGNECPAISPIHPGSCQFGLCAPRLSDCFADDVGPKTCEELCDGEGGACSDGACQGRVLFRFADMSACDSFDGFELLPTSCGEPRPEEAGYAFRCCCEGL